MRKILIIILIVLFPVFALAYSESGGTYTLNTEGGDDYQTDFASAYADCSNGDTIVIPAGSFVWDTKRTIQKGIHIQGAGIDTTTIDVDVATAAYQSSSFLFVFDVDGATAWELSGITFTELTNPSYFNSGGIIQLAGTTDNWRIHHCEFNGMVSRTMQSVQGIDQVGLIDNCEFTNGDGQYIRVYGSNTTAWTTETHPGGADAIYIEDCTFTDDDQTRATVDIESGGKVVSRFNTYHDSWVAQHGYEGTLGVLRSEIYNNTMTFDHAETVSTAAAEWRGGTMYLFNNDVSDTTYSLWYVFVAFHYCWYENRDTCGDITGCHLTACGSYPCTNQQGRTYNQGLEPMYMWGNTYDTVAHNSLDLHEVCAEAVLNLDTIVDEDREYYLYDGSFDGTSGMGSGLRSARPATCTTGVGYWSTDQGDWNSEGADGVLDVCTSTDTWTDAYYEPYDYPHPLQGPDSTPPTMESATVETGGTTLTIQYSESVTQGTGYNDADLDVDISGGSSNVSLTYVSGDGTATHTYTIGETVDSGMSLDIDFNGDTDSLEDDSGNDLAAITNGSVTNYSAQAPPSGEGTVSWGSGGSISF